MDTLPPVLFDPIEGDNAFTILGGFAKAARRAGWPQPEIDKVLTEAKSSDYDHLFATILAVIE